VVAGVIAGIFPAECLSALFAVPLLIASGRAAMTTYETPREFIPAIRAIVSCYMLAVTMFTLAIAFNTLVGGGR
jgi:1,4-dihydroxy-2-naphthoate octaprenyltransferase